MESVLIKVINKIERYSFALFHTQTLVSYCEKIKFCNNINKERELVTRYLS